MEGGRFTQRVLGAIVLIAMAFIAISVLIRGTDPTEVLTSSIIHPLPNKTQETPSKIQETPSPIWNPKKVIPTTQTTRVTHPKNWVVQLGSFSNQNNALKLLKDAEKTGFRVFSYPYFAQGKKMTSVLVGPVSDRTEALALQAQLDDAMQLKGILRPFNPEQEMAQIKQNVSRIISDSVN